MKTRAPAGCSYRMENNSGQAAQSTGAAFPSALTGRIPVMPTRGAVLWAPRPRSDSDFLPACVSVSKPGHLDDPQPPSHVPGDNSLPPTPTFCIFVHLVEW